MSAFSPADIAEAEDEVTQDQEIAVSTAYDYAINVKDGVALAPLRIDMDAKGKVRVRCEVFVRNEILRVEHAACGHFALYVVEDDGEERAVCHVHHRIARATLRLNLPPRAPMTWLQRRAFLRLADRCFRHVGGSGAGLTDDYVDCDTNGELARACLQEQIERCQRTGVHEWFEWYRHENDDRIRTLDECACGVERHGVLAKRYAAPDDYGNRGAWGPADGKWRYQQPAFGGRRLSRGLRGYRDAVMSRVRRGAA